MFKYLDKVKIIDGFYEGCEGILLSINERIRDDAIIYISYTVELRAIDCRNCYHIESVDIPESDLAKI